MRILASASPLEGHLRPLLPLSMALASRGHGVHVATHPDLHPRVRRVGLTPVSAGPTYADAWAALPSLGDYGAMSPFERGGAAFSRIIAPAKLVDLEQIAAGWRPDLIVFEWTDLAAPLVAARLGIPSVTQGVGVLPPVAMDQLTADARRLWCSRDLEPEPHAGVFRDLYLHPVPLALQPDPGVPCGQLRLMRLDMSSVEDVEQPPLPGWVEHLADKSVVFVSLGTMGSFFSTAQRFKAVVAGLLGLDLTIIVATGEHLDPADLGPQPENVHVERWLPLSKVLPVCSAVVCHAGSGTMLASLSAGRPLVLLPRGADQFNNAAACLCAGVGRVLQPEQQTSEAIAREVETVLTDGAYRQAALQARDEIQAMPSPCDLVSGIEAHVNNRARSPSV
jgi:UDP:flavonoid glycosyltransferase YjiC (YdhE family)